jgi:hypothetical protein
MFGSTVEHVLRSFTEEYEPNRCQILADGSMHSFTKEFHPTDIFAIKNFNNYQPDSITTPIYPFNRAHLPEILNEFGSLLFDNQSVLIYADSLRSCELNLLFQYHKIATGSYNMGLDIFCGENAHDIVNWNTAYQSWHDMQSWELREWFSLFYSIWTQEWIDSYSQAPNNFLKISNTELLLDTTNSLLKIIDFCHLTCKSVEDLRQFATTWQTKQNYILEEFALLDQIIEHTLNKIEFNWKDLNIIAESIIQQRLRENNYEIQCNGLNIFPTNSISLYNLLEKC